jgi:hypothetical protein
MSKLKNRILKIEEKTNVKNKVIPFIVGRDQKESEVLDKYFTKHPEDKDALKIIVKLN